MQESTSVDIKNCRFLAYLCDGPTDTGIREQEIDYCCYVKEGNPVTKFLCMQHLEHTHAYGILDAIEKVVCNRLEIPITNTMYQKDINCNFNRASVMPVCQGGVCIKVQEKQPAMAFTHCIALKLELAVLDSVKFDTNFEKLHSTLSAMFLCHYIYQWSVEKYKKSQVFLKKHFSNSAV